MSSEHERIARIRQVFARTRESVFVGIGDDSAVLNASARKRVWTVDSAVEGVHFSLAFMRHDEVGYRAFMAAASDIAAMGATAHWALCALNLPTALSEPALDTLLSGLASAADELNIAVVGGNLTRASELSLTITVLGELDAPLIARAGARPGDGIYVTGPVGGAALGFHALRAGMPRKGRYEAAIRQFLRPHARLAIAPDVARHASAGLDISDGLTQDLAHLCSASQVAAELHYELIPTLPDFATLAQALSLSPAALLLGGGEDYELLFTADAACVPATLASRIGFVRSGAGVHVRDREGNVVPVAAGFDHFR